MPTGFEHLLAEGVITEVLGRLQSGKEAEVYVVRFGGKVVAAKVYKDRATRSFKNNSSYKEGRTVRNTRSQRAMDRGSRFGKAASEDAWKSAEADALYKLHAEGVRVPTPVLFLDGVLLMELVLDAEGNPAQRIIDAHLTPAEANAAYHDMLTQLVRILSCDHPRRPLAVQRAVGGRRADGDRFPPDRVGIAQQQLGAVLPPRRREHPRSLRADRSLSHGSAQQSLGDLAGLSAARADAGVPADGERELGRKVDRAGCAARRAEARARRAARRHARRAKRARAATPRSTAAAPEPATVATTAASAVRGRPASAVRAGGHREESATGGDARGDGGSCARAGGPVDHGGPPERAGQRGLAARAKTAETASLAFARTLRVQRDASLLVTSFALPAIARTAARRNGTRSPRTRPLGRCSGETLQTTASSSGSERAAARGKASS